MLDALLDQAKAGGLSNRKLAQELGCSPATLTLVRQGLRPLPDAAAVRLARILGRDEGELLTEILMERQQDPETRRVLESMLKKLRAASSAGVGIVAAVAGAGAVLWISGFNAFGIM